MSIREKALIKFIEKYKHTAEQGSLEWLQSRIFRIGGSEISTILGLNPYSNEKKLIKQHIGIDTFKGYPATWFGNLMEPILTDYINNYFNCFIHETGAINTDNNLGYSPDGLAVILKDKLNDIINEDHLEHIKNTSNFENNHEDNDLLILFEFKCPYRRIPHKTDIPEYYLPQPLLGMEIINICEIGIFIEALYRFCSIDDLAYTNNYNNVYHSDKIKINSNPIYYGFMLITYDINNFIDENEGDLLDKLENDNYIHNVENYLNRYKDIKINVRDNIINDLGKLTNKWILNQILEHLIQKKHFNYTFIEHKTTHKFENSVYDKPDYIKNIYNYDIKNDIYTEIDQLIMELPENIRVIGILPYKLFDIYIKPVNKQVNFITEDVQKKVDNVINIIKECHTDDKTVDDKKKIIDSYYKK